jgi:hypothetical protein
MIDLENAKLNLWNGKVAECYVECFNRMLYVIFKDTTSGDIDDIENIMEDSYDEWASGDNEKIIDICCEEYILGTLNVYKDKIVAVIYEGDEDEDN